MKLLYVVTVAQYTVTVTVTVLIEMNDAPPDQLTENVIHEFYSNRNYKLKHSTRRNHNGVTLDALSISTHNTKVNHHEHNNDIKTTAPHFSEDSSFDDDDDLTIEASLHQQSLMKKKKKKNVHNSIIDNSHSNSIVKSRMTKQLQPLISHDSHRIGHLMHKVSAVSGDSVLTGSKGNNFSTISSTTVLDLVSTKSTMKKSHSSPADISTSSSNIESMRAVRTNDVSKYQLKIMQESADLKEHIGDVLHLHDHLSTIIVEQLTHRAELAKAVGLANDRYIELFELILSEMLKTQRLKFKVRIV